jgi:hypothetical protein
MILAIMDNYSRLKVYCKVTYNIFEWDMEICDFKCKNILLNNFEIGTLSEYYKVEPGRSRIYNPKLPNMGFIAIKFN